jgi:hypothetical protein
MATAEDDAPQAGGIDDRAREGVEHLQAAAREMIRAARALLDVAEELVDDPTTATNAIGALGTLAQAAVGRMTAPVHGEPGPPDEGDDDGRVQRITVT